MVNIVSMTEVIFNCPNVSEIKDCVEDVVSVAN